MPAIVAASSAAAPTTLGKLASSVVGLGGASLSMRPQSPVKAARAIRDGQCEIALAGSSEAIHPLFAAGFYNMGVLADHVDPTQACRPFDANRAGFVMGEGAGMFVLYTNPRGSSGYGGEFQDMIRNRWGDEDYMDLMKAVDICVARPDVDPARLGVSGGSYGGFMTAWITTKTERFKAAQADRMIVNWVSWYGNSDAQSLTEGEFLGNPWQSWDSYINMSPIKYADKVKTPTLMVQSEEDFRAPISDAEQWFMALKKHNVPAEFIRYPRSNHELSRSGEPWLLTDRLSRIRQWFSYWLKDEKPRRLTTTASSERQP